MQKRMFERIMRARMQQRRQSGPNAGPSQNRGRKPQPANQ